MATSRTKLEQYIMHCRARRKAAIAYYRTVCKRQRLGMSQREIAAADGIQYDALRNRLTRARKYIGGV